MGDQRNYLPKVTLFLSRLALGKKAKPNN